MNLDEWKDMALAAFGAPDGPEYKRMRDLVELRDDGWVDVDLNYFRYYLKPVSQAFAPGFSELFGSPRGRDEPLDSRHAAIAAALQRVTEEARSTCFGTCMSG